MQELAHADIWKFHKDMIEHLGSPAVSHSAINLLWTNQIDKNHSGDLPVESSDDDDD